MNLEGFTRTQTNAMIAKLKKKSEETRDFLHSIRDRKDIPEHITELVFSDLENTDALVRDLERYLDTLVSRCTLCGNRAKTEVKTLAHICTTCDEKTDPRKKLLKQKEGKEQV